MRKLQQLLPFLAFSFSVSAATCKTNSLGLKLKCKKDVCFGYQKDVDIEQGSDGLNCNYAIQQYT